MTFFQGFQQPQAAADIERRRAELAAEFEPHADVQVAMWDGRVFVTVNNQEAGLTPNQARAHIERVAEAIKEAENR